MELVNVVVDVLLLVAFLLTAVAGLRNGFFRELFSLFGLGAGVLAGLRFTGPILERVPSAFLRTELATAIVFLIVFLAVFAATVALGGLLAMVWEGKSPGLLSRFMGLGFGAVRGLILVLVLAGAMALMAPQGSQTLAQSRVLPWLSGGIEVASALLPEDVGYQLRKQWDALPFEQRGERHEIRASHEIGS